MNPTLAPAYIATIRKCVVVIATKYISASLLTVSRMLGTFTPRYVDLMRRICTTTKTKTAMSMRTGSLRNRGGRKSDGIHTKGKREGHLN